MVFITLLSIKLNLRSHRRLHINLHDPQNKKSEIWSSPCRRMGWIGHMFRRNLCLKEENVLKPLYINVVVHREEVGEDHKTI